MKFSALTNPELDVFLLFTYDVGFFNKSRLPLVDALLSYRNIYLNYLNVVEYAENSPLEAWLKSGKVYNSSHIVEHVSDVLRILTLWKYGGTYLDLDVIITKQVSSIGTNFACMESGNQVNSAIVNLDAKLGRSIAEKNFERVIAHFNGNSWAGNGPKILSDLVKEMCNTTDQSQMTRDKCNGFEVLPTEACYAVNYNEWMKFFEEKSLQEVIKRTENSFAVHFWNHMSGNGKLSTNSSSAYIKFAKEFCPRVLAASGANF